MRMHHGLIARLVEVMMGVSLRRTFGRVEWVGPWPDVPPDRPVVLLMNHPSFYDGYVGWLVARRVLKRRALVWMRDWERFPFFAAAGALPFSHDDARTRAATIRKTARLLASPNYALIYFPTGRLHPPEEGAPPFDEALLARLDDLLPPRTWLPLALYLTWDAGPKPIVRLAAGKPTATLQGDERDRLATLLDTLRQPQQPATLLLGSTKLPQEQWDFRFMRAFFRRYL